MKKIFYLLFIISLISCCEKTGLTPTPPPLKDSNNINISILIDLSDRIDPVTNPNPTMEYYQRDLEYIKAINKGFLSHIEKKKVIRLNDQMQVFFNPEPSDPKINDVTRDLKISFDKNTSKDNMDMMAKNYSTLPVGIYESAIKDGSYVGSDIWEFFQNKVKDYCIKDDHRNILFILTDGYMYHANSKFFDKTKTSYLTSKLIQSFKLNNSNFKEQIKNENLGFVKANDNLGNLEVVVLGINPEKGNPFEEAVIKEFWENWFKDMGITRYQIKSADLPSNLEPIITKAITNKN
ncbi:hypothetical protein [uncultured Chryseobacterium sp.]|uniref:hypothetical protein n=1 Tax=uncultured Chryseobacterium sp. TaxID=259322 RepID=UPI0025E82AE4|nr:hypothetical protein [uncultured Chryseobacterium sp.]